MEHSNFNYVLELSGKDYISRSDQDGNLIPNLAFKESNYFNTLREAVGSLILVDIRKFEEMSNEVKNDRYFEYACIKTTDNNSPLVEIIRLSFNDTPDGVPSAGIYMNFENTTEDFEQLSGYDFSEFREYDPHSPFLLLASYSYDMGFKTSIDEALSGWVYSLKHHESSAEFSNEEWKYKVGITQTSLSTPPSNELTNYHYQNLSDALSQLLHTEVTKLDQHPARKSERENWVSNAGLIKRGKGKLVEFVTVKDGKDQEIASEPGVHLKFYAPIKELEQESGIALSELGNYKQDDKYLLIANYNQDSNELLPYPGYLSLLKTINKDHPLNIHSVEQAPYLLRITWVFTQHLFGNNNYPPEQQAQSSICSSLEEAVDCIKEIDVRFLDEQQAIRLGYPFFVKQADIIDGSNNAVIVSKFQVREEGEQLPAGIYMKLNEDYVSVEILKLFRSDNRDASQNDSTQLLITSAKNLQLLLPEDTLERKNRTTQRTINPTGNTGMKV